MNKLHATLIALMSCSCARTDIYFPPDGKTFDENGGGGSKAPSYHRAVVLNGSDSLGNTQIEVTSNSVRYASAGGIDNSTSTREGYRTVRHGVGTAATAAVLGIGLSQAASAYSANQAAAATSNVAASRSAAAIAASKAATTVRLAEIAAQKEAAAAAANAAAAAAAKTLPAAGSVIPATIPATVVPVP